MKGPLVLLAALVTGILAGDAWGPDPAGWVLALAIVGIAAAGRRAPGRVPHSQSGPSHSCSSVPRWSSVRSTG